MILPVIKIRLLQLMRLAGGLGLMRVVFLAAMGAFLLFALFAGTTVSPGDFYVSAGYLFVILVIHVNRKDKKFLKLCSRQPGLIFFVEYLLLLLPLLLCLIRHQHYVTILGTMALLPVIIHVEYRPKVKSLNSAIQRLIPSSCFEWKSGVRTALFFMACVWIVGLATSFFAGSVPVALFLLGITPLGFYEKGEPVHMILALEMDAGRFILHKIKLQLALFSCMALPLMAAFIAFHTSLWYIPVIEYIVLISSHIFIVLTKYTFYQPNQKSGGAQVFGVFGALAMLIPVFIPLIWMLSIRFYLKSVKNLNFYLHDYN